MSNAVWSFDEITVFTTAYPTVFSNILTMFIYGRRIGEVDIYVIPIIANMKRIRIDADRLFFPFSIIL
jgi:hypothetical protein